MPRASKPAPDLPILLVGSQGEWEAWLDTNHEKLTGVWLKLAKKGAGSTSVTYAEALEAALCFGWIDGQKAALDEQFWLQRFTPRGPRSQWSRVNREKALELQRQGRLRPAGQAALDQAAADGRLAAAYEPQRTAAVPDDLQQALDEHPAASAFFATLNSRNRFAILYRLQSAKQPQTRARRLQQFVAMLEQGKTIYP